MEALDLNYERLRVRRPREEKRLLASLGETGQQCPVVVVPGDSPGRYVVIDGGKRVRALRKLKADVAKAVIWEMTPAQALIIAYQMRASGGWNVWEEGWVVYELHRKHNWSLAQIDTALDKSQGWASRRLGLVETLPERVLDEVHKGHIGAYAAMKYLLPLARANAQDCEKLARHISELSLKSRQVGLLYQYYLQGPRSAAAKIIDEPMLFLRALEESRRGAGQGLDSNPGESRVFKNLELIANVSSGLAWHLPKVFGSDTVGPAKDKLSQVWGFCQERLGRLQKTMTALLSADEPNKVHAG